MTDQAKPNQPVQVNMPPEIAKGHYINSMLVSHTPVDFSIDFIQIMPAIPQAEARGRMIMAPQHAKALLEALKMNLEKYETRYGNIEVVVVENPLIEPAPEGTAN